MNKTPTEIEAWKTAYIQRFIEAGFSQSDAEWDYEHGIYDHDYNQNPRKAADDSISYYEDDD